MANFNVPASRNGLPTKVISIGGIGTNPAYFNRKTNTSPVATVAPVAQLSSVQRQQVAGTNTPVSQQAQVVRPSSPRQNNVTGALLHVNSITPAHTAAVNNAPHGAIVGIQNIHGSQVKTSIARGPRPGANSIGIAQATGASPKIRRSIHP